MTERWIFLSSSAYRNIQSLTFLRVRETINRIMISMLIDISILVIYFVIMIERWIFLSSPALRNVRILMFLRIRIRLIGSEILMSKYTYVNYILCHHDKKGTLHLFFNL